MRTYTEYACAELTCGGSVMFDYFLESQHRKYDKGKKKDNRQNDNHGSAEVLAVLLPAAGCSSYLTLLPVVRNL